MSLHDYIHNTLGYSEYEIAQIKYFVNGLLSEISKILLIGSFFLLTGKLNLFLSAAIILCLLRIYTGGLHFNHYASCLAMSFSIFYIGICVLANIPVIKPIQLILLCICILINYTYAPVVSKVRPIPDGVKIHRSKRNSFWIITLYVLIVFIIPDNPYTNIGFWMIILQSIQLIAAKLFERRYICNEA